jgi:hypothetical protein
MTIATALVSNSGGNVYTSTGNTVISYLSVFNYSGSTVTANVHVVPSGSSANTQNQISTVDITSTDTYLVYANAEKLILGNGDAIYVIANAATSLNAVTSYTSA